jgi:hypothetical protein
VQSPAKNNLSRVETSSRQLAHLLEVAYDMPLNARVSELRFLFGLCWNCAFTWHGANIEFCR